MNNEIMISPSILSTDFLHLEKSIRIINESEANWVHMDIMDGVFVPNISFGFPIMESVKKISTKPLDVHLMIVNPEKYIEKFAKTGASIITVHYETCSHLHSTIQQIKSTYCKAGVALNPHTDISLIKPVLKDVDLVLIMSVNPGFGGQEFIENTYDKILELRELANRYNPDLIIQVDGGIRDVNAVQLAKSGVDCFVVGTYIFKSPDPVNTINNLKYLKF